MDLLNYDFKNYNGDNLERDVKQFIVDFCEYDGILDKRINKLFSINPFIKQKYEKEDVKQEVILALLTKATNKFPYLTGEKRLRYFNTVVSSVICNLLRDKFDSVATLVLDTDMRIDNEIAQDSKTVNEIFDLFVNEQLERQLVELYYEGYNDEQIKDIMELGRRRFEAIRDNVRQKIKEEL